MPHPQSPRWFLEALNTPYDRGSVEVDGCPINYLRWGDARKPGVILIHGGAAHAHWWAFIAPQLARNHHVVALDLSGHGDSGKRSAYERETWADEVMAVAKAREDAALLIVTDAGFGKRTQLDKFKRQGRGGQGVRGIKITAKAFGVGRRYPIAAKY